MLHCCLCLANHCCQLLLLLLQFQRLAGQVEFASEMVDSELQLKVQMEERVAG